MKKTLSVLLALLMAIGLAAPAFAAEVPQDLVYAVATEPAGLDPHLTTAHASILVHKNIYSRLLVQMGDMSLQPELAESWEMSEDGLTYTFHLRQGVKFHNGREMTADDVVYSYERMINPDVGSVARNYFLSVASVEAADPYTVVFTLSAPDATFIGYVASNYAAIVPKEVVEEFGDLKANTCGTGPYKLREYVEGNRIVLEKNPDFFLEGQPKLDTLTYVIMADEAARLAALRTGEVHIAKLSATNLPLVEGNSDITVMEYLTPNYDYIGFNLFDVEPLKDKRVRQAISLLIDREAYADMIYDGHATVVGPVSVSMGNWPIDITGNEFYTRDVEKAKALLAEAGYPDGFTLKMTAGVDPETTNGAQVIQAQLAEGGIMVEIEVLELAQYIDAWREHTHESIIGMNGAGSDPDRSLNFFFSSTSSTNVWGYSNPRIDELGIIGKTATTDAERKAAYDEMQEIILDELPNLFLVARNDFMFVRSNVDGYIAETYYTDHFENVSLK